MRTQNAESYKQFPTRNMIWPGAILASVAHAIFVAYAPLMSHEQSWDGLNYNVQNSQGSRGTIAFGQDKVSFVAVFYLASSPRDPLKRGVHAPTGSKELLQSVPTRLKKLADDALQYVLQDVDGQAIPIITAAFWSDLESPYVTGSEPWQIIVENGASLVKHQILPVEIGLRQWVREFEFTLTQIALVKSIFQQRMAATSGTVQISSVETQQIMDMADGDEGLEACRESFSEIGMVLP
jgi:hypothetical protein